MWNKHLYGVSRDFPVALAELGTVRHCLLWRRHMGTAWLPKLLWQSTGGWGLVLKFWAMWFLLKFQKKGLFFLSSCTHSLTHKDCISVSLNFLFQCALTGYFRVVLPTMLLNFRVCLSTITCIFHNSDIFLCYCTLCSCATFECAGQGPKSFLGWWLRECVG